MSLGKKAIARIIIINPKTRKNFWQGTAYQNGFKSPKEIIKKIKEALTSFEEKTRNKVKK